MSYPMWFSSLADLDNKDLAKRSEKFNKRMYKVLNNTPEPPKTKLKAAIKWTTNGWKERKLTNY